MNPLHTLYLCYFGLREPLVQTQVLPYLRELAAGGLKVSLLTFEPDFKKKWNDEQINAARAALSGQGISWHVLPYHKSPSVPATFYDVLNGARFIHGIVRRERIDVLHARSHVPATMGAIVKNLSGGRVKLLFDIRGFFPEEYTDAGVWKENGGLYHTVKRVERWLLNKSDGFVVLSEKARQILFAESAESGFDKFNRPVEVIPCCVDLQKFEAANEVARREVREKLRLDGRRVIVYVGSLGSWYLGDEMADLMAAAREQDPQTFALVLTQSPPELMTERLKRRGFTDDDFLVTRVSPAEMPRYLSAADVALSFIKACYSKLSSSPTKIAEYLAAGLPIITNGGVGDVAEVIEADKVGAVVEDFSRASYLKVLQEIEILRQKGDLAAKCRESARRRFDLSEVGGAKYRFLYQRLSANGRKS